MGSLKALLRKPSGRLPLVALIVLAAALVALAGMPRGAEAAIDSEEQAVLTLINNYRQANGLGSLSLNGELNATADWMSNDMAAKDYFSHTDSLGRDPFQRMADFGYGYNTWKGENLAAGVYAAQAALDLWKGSPGHDANMLNPNFKVIGIARVYGDGNTYGWYWSTEFGGQGSPPPPVQPTPEPAPPPPPPPNDAVSVTDGATNTVVATIPVGDRPEDVGVNLNTDRVYAANCYDDTLSVIENPPSRGYWLVASDGGIFTYGDAGFFGSAGEIALNQPIVSMAATPGDNGYWLVASDGGIFAFGDAGFFGSTGSLALNQSIVDIAATPSGNGYWLVASDGGIFSFGDAGFFGSTGDIPLNQPIVGMAVTPSGNGYWLVTSDGGIFTYGDAGFHGSTSDIPLNQPVVGMAATPSGNGYWLVASDGGIFTFGDAGFFNSTGSIALNQPIVGMAATPSGNGYWLVASDGGIFAFGDAGFFGSTSDIALN